ncbi:MAG: 2-dehydropantoate 2-reductase [Desulfarculaceae bacterium]|nr:2-dehydropantoate 2-reductase [Desulfarculaceae bacterium]MCF8073791.1 2-dehydropantoate 2-reductase [Desulfarculaceae bacterium]MCF8102032.1 2-dehydropantoate 2-reductase [Desulfarculaceae bacterium]MCF8116002.1 2-dehydropantoate 2-reductase [Desulfarculaceae bacterium]
MKQIQTVWVVGAGAMGSVLAALLHKSGKVQTHLVGASPHWQKVGREGLAFETSGQGVEQLPVPARAWEDIPRLGPTDLVLLTGKATDLPKVAERLGPLLGEEAAIFAVQNGLGVRELAERLLKRPVEAGVAFFGAHSAGPGQVTFFGPGRVVLTAGEGGQALSGLLPAEAVRFEMVEDYRRAEWSKLAVNCLANPLAGILNLTSKELTQAALDPAKEALLAEVKAVAMAEGVELEITVAKFNSLLKSSNIPSLRTDVERGRPTEIDFLNGAIVELAAKHGIPAPANQLVTSLIKTMTG